MSRRTLRAGLAGGLAAALTLIGVAAHADPNPNPDVGTPIAGKAPLDLYAGVGADAFAELSNNFVSQYNAQSPAPTRLLESYDAVNPVTGATGVRGEHLDQARLLGDPATQRCQRRHQRDRSEPEEHRRPDVLLHRLGAVEPVEGHGCHRRGAHVLRPEPRRRRVRRDRQRLRPDHAPDHPQVRDIFECTDHRLEPGRRAGGSHPRLRPPTTAATYTFFLTAIGSSLPAVQSGCGAAGSATNSTAERRDAR